MQYSMFVATSVLLDRAGKKLKLKGEAIHSGNYAYEVAGSFESRRRHVVALTYSISTHEIGIAGLARMRKGGSKYTILPGGQAGTNLTQFSQYGASRACVLKRGRYDAARSMNMSASSPSLAHLPDQACIELYDEENDRRQYIPLPTEAACKGLLTAIADELPSCLSEDDAKSIDNVTLRILGATLLSRGTLAPNAARYPYCLYPMDKIVPVSLDDFLAA
ncbi:hypothetical protein QAO71_16960 (plasmid) [Halopseudomonas sp. SMJS2]|uniref:hypothetical protein n=1 Tax=Halopseudomonas sp. SMJS2 TaxID=3041098 RepID=UPI00245318D2|nr:hypothetical protein [Halopseudomonas sp. SMJS2]WGK63461.1 hypothetical protein QAO71_16960 [Halopseudomonas sp. SMJS2]